MTRVLLFLLPLSLLVACSAGDGSNPFSTAAAEAEGDGGTDAVTNTGDPIDSNRTILPGTENPSSNDSIFRREARSGESGDGFAEGFRYDGDTDRFFVDNLAFDGEGGYTRVTAANGSNLGIGPFGVWRSAAVATDSLTSAGVTQLEYRALYGVNPRGTTSVAIVRTGGYIEYGFGGFIYQREGGVTLPESGQAVYTGTDNYGGLRDFVGKGGLEYVNGDMEVRIDFNDFNEGAGVIGVVSNRRIFDLNGNDVTGDILTAFGGVTQLPNLFFVIQDDVLDSNGEMTGRLQSTNPASGEIYEEGNYYAVLSGPQARDVTGVVVVTAEDPRSSDVTVRETAGFFASR